MERRTTSQLIDFYIVTSLSGIQSRQGSHRTSSDHNCLLPLPFLVHLAKDCFLKERQGRRNR